MIPPPRPRGLAPVTPRAETKDAQISRLQRELSAKDARLAVQARLINSLRLELKISGPSLDYRGTTRLRRDLEDLDIDLTDTPLFSADDKTYRAL